MAPYLMWSEASSVLYELRWRKEISAELAAIALGRLSEADISPRRPKGLTDDAWRIVDRLGGAKTYDAEYLALAKLLRCRLLTTDAKLKTSGARVVGVIGPSELVEAMKGSRDQAAGGCQLRPFDLPTQDSELMPRLASLGRISVGPTLPTGQAGRSGD